MPAPVQVRPSDRRFGARALLLAGAFVLIAVPFLLLLLLVEDHSRALRELDGGARDQLHSYAVKHHGFVIAMKLVSLTGTSVAWLVIFVPIVGWLLWRRLPRLAAFVALTVPLSSLLNNLVKLLVHRTRPSLNHPVAHAGGNSFPSGHAQAAVVGYGVLVLVFLPVLHGAWRRLALAAAVLMVLAIGFSRIALGVHYVSDVLAGYALGAAWLAAMTAAFSAWRRERGRPEVAPHAGLEPEQERRLSPDEPAPSSAPPE
ncbi:MAG: phosphatase PAP2 family protein [Actinomycetota bacterium]|nr:phosphatase PAP2 family protein [Actinomycetota bacterium]